VKQFIFSVVIRMTDVSIQIENLPSQFDEKMDLSDVPQAPKASDDEKRDAWSLLSDVDPVSGLPYAWLDIREALMEGGPAKGLPMIFDYYCERNPSMDAYTNYLLACSHFTTEELEMPTSKGARRRLELRIKKAVKKHKGPMNINKFYYENGAELLKDE
jgi:hypothetical protein